MSEWMLYVYKQFPKPENIHGVDVKLQAIGPDGTVIYIGTVTCDENGRFSYLWTPPGEGVYRIMAVFEGSKSYWPSHAETSLGVTAAPTPTATAEQAGALQSAIEALSPLITALIVIVVACVCLVAYDIYINRKMLKQLKQTAS